MTGIVLFINITVNMTASSNNVIDNKSCVLMEVTSYPSNQITLNIGVNNTFMLSKLCLIWHYFSSLNDWQTHI